MSTIFEMISKYHAITAPKLLENFKPELERFFKYVRLYSALMEQLATLPAFASVHKIPTFLGIEVEVENIHKELPLPSFWQVKTDGSLRNGGMEFVCTPLMPEQAMIATVALWMILHRFIPSHAPDFSWRTSVHVHLNILDLSEEEFRCLLLLCVIFEPSLFAFAGKDREDSIFCVPLMQSSCLPKLSQYFRKEVSLHELATTWPKYTAVNLFRMYASGPEIPDHPEYKPALGTLEFRHLGGTAEVIKVLRWQALILQLFQGAVALKQQEILDLLGTPEILTKKVFGMPMQVPDKNTVLKIRQMFVKCPQFKAVKASSALAKMAERAVPKQTPPKRPKAKPSTNVLTGF